MQKKKIKVIFLFILVLIVSSISINCIYNVNTGKKNITKDFEKKLINPSAEDEIYYTKISEFDDNFGHYSVKNLFIKDNFVFIGAGSEGVIILDISNISAPKHISQFYCNYNVEKIFVSDNYMYLAVNYQGVQIVNITDIYHPEIVGFYYEPYARIISVYVVNDLAYIGTIYMAQEAGLGILNISSKTNPIKIYQSTNEFFSSINDVYVDNNLAYVSAVSGIWIYDVSNPTNTQLIQKISGYRYIEKTFIENKILYAVSEFYGFMIYNIEQLTSPVLLSRYLNGTSPVDISVKENIAYIISLTYGLLLLNVSDLTDPKWISNDNKGDKKISLLLMDNYALVAENTRLLQIYNVTDKKNLNIVTNMTNSGFSYALTAQNDIVYIADGQNCVEIINVVNKIRPEKISTYFEEISNITDISIFNKSLFIVDEVKGLIIVNITNPAVPQKIANWTNGGQPKRVAIENNYAYLVDFFQGLEIINVTDITNPQLVYTYMKTGITDLFVKNDVLFISIKNTGFDILNVTNKLLPTLIKTFSKAGTASSITIYLNKLFLANKLDGLNAFDITNLSNPLEINVNLTITDVENIFVNNSLIFIACGGAGLFIIKNNEDYELVGSFDDGGEAQSVIIDQSFIYLADGYDNLEIIGKDNENDGLADYLEEYYGTNPLISDTDEDGLSDGIEVLFYRLNPLSNDTDTDLISDYYEIHNGLNPKNENDALIDLDNDGLTNLEEYQNGTNIRDADSDDDSLEDGDEVNIHLTNPNDPDTDDDGWSDSWELYYGTNPLDPLDFPDFETTPPVTEPPPTTPWKVRTFSYYYLFIPVGLLIGILFVIYLVGKLKKPGIV